MSSRGRDLETTEYATPERPSWLWIVLAWVFLSVISAGQIRVDRPPEANAGRLLADLLWASVSWSFWLVAAPLVLALGRRFPLSRQRLRHVSYHIFASFAFALGHVPVFAVTTRFFAPLGETDLSFQQWMRAILSWSLHAELAIYWAVLGAGQALAHLHRARERERRANQLELQLGAARLEALRSQLRPHFLFNALNTVAMLARQRRHHEAAETVAALAELLRATLNRDQQTSELAVEIELVKLYLDIEKARFGDRLSTEIHVPEDLLELEVPSLVLQPLVENAIRHGLAHSERGGALKLEATVQAGRLELTVTNDGPAPDGGYLAEGIGLGNTRARLHQLFGEDASLELVREGDKTIAHLALPCAEAAG